MKTTIRRAMAMGVVLAAGFSAHPASAINYADHYEFEAQLAAPFKADDAGRRDTTLLFRFPGADEGTVVAWRLELLSPQDRTLRTWRGQTSLVQGAAAEHVEWFESDRRNSPLPVASGALPGGIYNMRLTATAIDASKAGVTAFGSVEQVVDAALAGGDLQEQVFPIQIGQVAEPAMPQFARLPVGAGNNGRGAATTQSLPAAGGVPYRVFLGNLHSQTNHSDGGGALSTCTGSQNPQAGAFGPSDAFLYGFNHGLNILAATEHNHYFDGSTGTNASASPTTAHNRYASGLSAATSFNSSHPGFLAVYGMEWGVISGGGHLNIFNSNSLLSWEYNSSGQLIGDLLSPRGNYPALYTQMRANSWVGQFNHPESTGQFTSNGVDLGYTADGDQVMVLCEVLNSSAFSTNTSETETGRSSYQTACNRLLEAGYHVAFSTDQDNHCANWGVSYTNRTGVLIPNGTAISQSSFISALRARRVYATTDRTAQLVLTANGNIMGSRFTNTGSLTLTMNYAPGTGRRATRVQIFQGVPGRNGTVTQLSTTATTTITPARGAHFYYALVTQDNGTMLWSAPVWVTQN